MRPWQWLGYFGSLLSIIAIWIVLLLANRKHGRDLQEVRARINALEATVEPLAYDSVDYDNRLAKIEGKKRIQEETDDGK